MTFATVSEPLAVDKRSIRALHILDKDQWKEEEGRRKAMTTDLASCLLRTFESKKPFLSPGAVFELVCLPIFVRWL